MASHYMSGETTNDNPTRAYISEVVTSGRGSLPLDINPALVSLSAQLVEARDGELVLRFTAPHSTTQGNGVVGGGAIASMLDLGMAMAVLSQLKPGFTCSTINLNVNLQASGKEGDFIAEAGVDKVGRRVAFAYAKLYDADRSRIIASATSSLAVIAIQPR